MRTRVLGALKANAASAAHVTGAQTYYFSSAVRLPVRHSQQATSSHNGQFMVIALAPTASAFVQMWGYATDAALLADQLTLIAELPIPVLADTATTGGHAPLRTP